MGISGPAWGIEINFSRQKTPNRAVTDDGAIQWQLYRSIFCTLPGLPEKKRWTEGLKYKNLKNCSFYKISPCELIWNSWPIVSK